ncbi:hypothetical protein EI555_003543 [Monodon monoceros]|uniref:Uncharacterized protein n=1 Tax=Monodon monoceros TaxID=40151 RepID=A0A4U1F6G6_MONMO|nr:hypothetical protein EI555_003543 [Monodon monoceros]
MHPVPGMVPAQDPMSSRKPEATKGRTEKHTVGMTETWGRRYRQGRQAPKKSPAADSGLKGAPGWSRACGEAELVAQPRLWELLRPELDGKDGQTGGCGGRGLVSREGGDRAAARGYVDSW